MREALFDVLRNHIVAMLDLYTKLHNVRNRMSCELSRRYVFIVTNHIL
jgi:hypothetical protein